MRAAWQWWNFSEAQSTDKPILRINLDETSCKLHYDQKRGLAVTRQRALSRAKKAEIVQDVSQQKLRGCFTHIAMICDDESLQPRLPQIFLGNEHIFTKGMVEAAQRDLAKNIILWGRKSAWANKATMVQVVQALATALGPELAARRVMLLLDAAKIHMGTGFLRACTARGILVHYVPAKLTWLLQPLDTHAFARFKVAIGTNYRREIMKHGQCDLSAMLRIVAGAVRKVLQGVRWAYAFDGNGFGKKQGEVRKTILEVLDQASAVGPSSQLPTYHQFTLIFPRRAAIPLADLLSFHRRRHQAAPHEPVPAAAHALEPAPRGHGPQPHAWHGRLRSSSFLSLPADEEAAGACSPPPAAAAASSGAAASSSGSGGLAAAPPYIERLFIPVVRPPAPPLRKRTPRNM